MRAAQSVSACRGLDTTCRSNRGGNVDPSACMLMMESCTCVAEVVAALVPSARPVTSSAAALNSKVRHQLTLGAAFPSHCIVCLLSVPTHAAGSLARVVFSLNGRRLGAVALPASATVSRLYPHIGMHSPNESVRFDPDPAGSVSTHRAGGAGGAGAGDGIGAGAGSGASVSSRTIDAAVIAELGDDPLGGLRLDAPASGGDLALLCRRGIVQDGDELRYKGTADELEGALLEAPLSLEHPAFDVKVLHGGTDNVICVGLSPSSYSLSDAPGRGVRRLYPP